MDATSAVKVALGTATGENPVVSTPRSAPDRILIEDVTPSLDGGRWPVKRALGTSLDVEATILRDGHDVIEAAVEVDAPDDTRAVHALAPIGGDRFVGSVAPTDLGLHRFRVVAWVNRWASWRDEVGRKVAAGQASLTGEAAEGAVLLRKALRALPAAERAVASIALEALTTGDVEPSLTEAIDAAIRTAGACREDVARSPWRGVDIDPERASFAAWYELFPRSFGGLRGVADALPRLAGLGFDIVYLPPVHPIGRTNRKGPNNTPTAAPGDVGSPWAIGASEGGHTAIHPELGTLDDFAALVARADELGIDIALDLALQCSPDHPWLVEHPEWFQRRPDGTIKFAENPPKRYEDIHNLDFGCREWRALWEALFEVVLTWVGRGVHVFRVDNPHTKPLPFWEWLIREVRKRHPETIFLAEAFTRPVPMRALAKAGFSQSYSYFTWKNTRAELSEFVELMADWADCVRPNLFTNTPDILHDYLQHGGPPAFRVRLILAATLSPSYGIYSGFEQYEGAAVRQGSEEYLDSEKYQLRERDLSGPLFPLVARLNAVRRAHAPLQVLDNTTVLETESEHVFAVARGSGVGAIIICVNVDPHEVREGVCVIPEWIAPSTTFRVRDLLTGDAWFWTTGPNYVRLEPGVREAHVLLIETF